LRSIKQIEAEHFFDTKAGPIWLIKSGNEYGIAQTRKKALELIGPQDPSVKVETPFFLYEMGNYLKTNAQYKLFAPQAKLINFVWSFFPFSPQFD